MTTNIKWYLDYKRIFYLILTISWVSGVIFFVLNSFFTVEGEFGIEKHPLQYLVLKIHGGSSFLMMVVYGFFISAHVKKNLKVRPQPISGIVILVMPIIMILTAYLLYYIASDYSRIIVSYTHLTVGFLMPVALIVHIIDVTSKEGKKKYKYRKV